MTEDQIERKVERMMDHLDRLLLSGEMNENDYDKSVKDLAQWADAQSRWSEAQRRVRI